MKSLSPLKILEPRVHPTIDRFSDGAIKPRGLAIAEATTKVWNRKTLVVFYIVMCLVQLIQNFAGGFTTALNPFITSSFSFHSLTATTGIIAALAAGLAKLPLAKFLDLVGRPQGLALAIASEIIGLIMLAACRNVETYCAGQVFFQIGLQAILFIQVILVVDTSALRHRALSLGILSIPSLVTTWITGPAAQSVLAGIGWRWGLVILAILCPFVDSMLVVLLWRQARQAERSGLVVKDDTKNAASLPHRVGRTILDFDLPGILILLLGLALFLLSFNLWTFQQDHWRSPLIISFITIGGLLIITFAIYEWRYARTPFIQWSLLKNRTVAGTYLFAITNFSASFIWRAFFYSMLIVVWDQSITHTTYIENIELVGAAITFLSVGALFLAFPKLRIKWLTFGFAVPMMMLALGLLYYFRYDDTAIRFVIMTQVFHAAGGGIVALSEQLTLMAVASNTQITALIAVAGVFNSIGIGIGSTIATVIWTSEFPAKLAKYLPAQLLPQLPLIYGSLPAQASFPKGSAAQVAVDRAYGDTEGYELIASLALQALSWGLVLVWEDVDLSGRGEEGAVLA